MPYFELVMNDGVVEVIEGADAYQQEGPMTTFFRCGADRNVVDAWSTRVASIRTADLRIIRRRDPAVARVLAS